VSSLTTASVHYDLNVEDMVAFQRWVTARSATYRQQVWLSTLATSLAIPDVVLLLTESTGWPFWPFPAMVCGLWVVVSVVICPWSIQRQQRRLVQGMLSGGRDRGMLGPCSMEVRPEALHVRGEAAETHKLERGGASGRHPGVHSSLHQ
jgi:hypothetical protein